MFNPRRSALLVTVFVTCVSGLAAQSAAKQSPFMPSIGPSGPTSVITGGTHELVGMIASSKQTLVGITDKTTRKSVWIPVGSAAEGIEVVSCDAKQDTAVVRIRGEIQTLSMHGSVVVGATATGSLPLPAPFTAPSVRTSAQIEQEKEARLLVSDLLEIGIQQRRAYEAAQKEAAGKKSGSTSPAAPVAR